MDLYKKLLEIRKSKDIKLSKNPFLKPEIILRYYQVIGVVHMYMVHRFVLGDSTGLGKTPQTIATYTTLLSKDSTYKMIVVCPSSALYQWQDEIDKFTVNVTSQVVESIDIKVDGKRLSSFDSREYQINQFVEKDKNVLIFNYNTLKSEYHILKELITKYKFILVFDEATSFKNNESQTWKAASELSKKAERVYALSATIIKNHLLEAFSIYKVVLPNLFGSIEHFTRSYCKIKYKSLWKGRGKKGRKIKEIVGYKNLDHFKKKIDPYYIGRNKSEVAKELPKINTKEIILKMEPKQEDLYNDVLEGFLDFNKFKAKILDLFKLEKEEVEEKEEDMVKKDISKLVALIYCQQICNSPYTMGLDIPSVKEKELLRLLETELDGDKVVIYTRFRKMVDRLEDLITKKLKRKCTKITGKVKNKQRDINKKLFNLSDDCNIILINSAAREAINLQSSGYLIFYDLPFSYGDFLQIIGRIHRIGSTHEKIFLIFLMCANTVDKKTYDILRNKKALFDEVLGERAEGALQGKQMSSTVNTLFEDLVKDAKNLTKR